MHLWDHSSLLGRETCVELTTGAREAHGAVRILDHDSGRVGVLAPGFRTFVADNVHA